MNIDCNNQIGMWKYIIPKNNIKVMIILWRSQLFLRYPLCLYHVYYRQL